MTQKNRKLFVSTGTMVGRSNGYDYSRAIEEIVKLKDEGLCDGLELMMLPFYYDKLNDVTSLVRESGLVNPDSVIHCEKEIGTMLSDAGSLYSDNKTDEAETLYGRAYELYRTNCLAGKAAGLHRMVLHLWGGIASDGHIMYNASKLNELSETAAEYGIRLLIENIPSNHGDPRSNWHKLLPLPSNTAFIFDTRFGKLHEQTADILTDKALIPHIEHVHISDFAGTYREFKALRPILHPGEGSIDFGEVAELLDNISYSGTITLESPVMCDTSLDIPKIKKTLSYINNIM